MHQGLYIVDAHDRASWKRKNLLATVCITHTIIHTTFRIPIQYKQCKIVHQ